MNQQKTLEQQVEETGKDNNEHNLVKFQFKLGNGKVNQTRKVYSLLDFGSDIGGLYGTVQPICAVLVALFSGSLFTANLVTNMYSVHNETSNIARENSSVNRVGPFNDIKIMSDGRKTDTETDISGFNI